LSAVGWALLEALHLYRRRSEPRHVDRGPMRFYHVLGWGLPAFITGLAVGLDPEGYGNPDFCWLSIHDSLVWSLAGPSACAVAVGVFFLVLAARASCAAPQGFEKKGTGSGLQTALVVLVLPSLAWLLALLAVNSDTILFHYLFAISNCLQGPLIFLFCVVLSREVRQSLRSSCARARGPDPALATKSTLTTVSREGGHKGWGCHHSHHVPIPLQAYSCDTTYVTGRLYQAPFGDSTGSLHSVAKSQHSYIPFVCREDAGLSGGRVQPALAEPGGLLLDAAEQQQEHDTDSDSDLSLEDDPSGSYGSTHSSDSEDEAAGAGWDALLRPEQPPAPTAPPSPPAGDSPVAPARPYWPGEFVTTASESDGHGGSETLRVEPAVGGEVPPRPAPLLPLPHPHKGILKKKSLPPISERSSALRPGQPVPPPPPPAGTAASSGSEGSRGGGPGAPRPRQSLQEQLSGAAPIAMSIRAGTVDEDSSGSE
ncbi:CELR2 protein, partial [Asarcornis scutulata]|nr:CELR2 protein [Asarcornis scutulata]